MRNTKTASRGETRAAASRVAATGAGMLSVARTPVLSSFRLAFSASVMPSSFLPSPLPLFGGRRHAVNGSATSASARGRLAQRAWPSQTSPAWPARRHCSQRARGPWRGPSSCVPAAVKRRAALQHCALTCVLTPRLHRRAGVRATTMSVEFAPVTGLAKSGGPVVRHTQFWPLRERLAPRLRSAVPGGCRESGLSRVEPEWTAGAFSAPAALLTVLSPWLCAPGAQPPPTRLSTHAAMCAECCTAPSRCGPPALASPLEGGGRLCGAALYSLCPKRPPPGLQTAVPLCPRRAAPWRWAARRSGGM